MSTRLGATNLNFVIDTGASVSIIPSKILNGVTIYPTPVSLTTASGSSIFVKGQTTIDVAFPALRRSFLWTFIVADTTTPLLGLDFLAHFGLLVDCKNRTITDKTTNRSAPLKTSGECLKIIVNHIAIPSKVQEIITASKVATPQHHSEYPHTGIYHRINTGSHPPVFAKPRRLSEDKLKCAKEEFRKLQKQGIITVSDSAWSSPLHMVNKKNGEFRPCGDYRGLNSITIPDRYPIPNLNDVSSKLSNKTVFSKIDLVQAYHHIRVHPDNECKTAITTPFGMFNYKFMPFGLRNSASTFQRMMDHIFSHLDCVFTYIDDILIFSESEESHLKDIKAVIDVLDKFNLKISLAKCVFCVPSLDFLGYNVSIGGLKPTESKVSELNSLTYPTNSKSLRRFLGMVGFYRKLIPHFASVVLPLTEKIRLFPNAKIFELTNSEKFAFDDIKFKLDNVTKLAHPLPNADQYQLVTDSSNYAVGAALHQLVDGTPTPIGFFSKKLSQAQQKYSVFDRELLAAYLAVIHFRHQIEGRNVLLFTDHKPLCSAFKSTTPSKSDRQQRHFTVLTEYISDIDYIKGSHNIVADCLSRPINAVKIDLCDLPEIAVCQAKDEEIKKFPDLKDYKFSDDLIIKCDISTPYPRPFIPVVLRESIFRSLHLVGHPGIKGTLKLVKTRHFWPDMDRNIREWCRTCLSCQQSKITKHTRGSISSFDLPSDRFQTVHIDIVGPLPPMKDPLNSFLSPNRYILTCIDRTTRWVEACPLPEITASVVAHAFVVTWISRFGVPLHVITDRGTQFESELFAELSKLVGFHRLRTTSYHPQCNGLIERCHRTIKTAITARKESWLTALPVVLLAIRSTPNESGFSPFTATTGTNLLIPRIMVNDTDTTVMTHSMVADLARHMSSLDVDSFSLGKIHSSHKSYIPKDLQTCSDVWLRVDRVRKPLEAPYMGPYKVLRRTTKHFTILLPNDVESTVSVDRLKPCVKFLDCTRNKKLKCSSDLPIDVPKLNPIINSDKNVNCDSSFCPSPDASSSTSRSGRRIRWKRDPSFYYYN